MFNRRAEFFYKALTDIEGYSIKKTKINEIFHTNPSIGMKMKKQVLTRYRRCIRVPLNSHKEENLQYFQKRKDIDLTQIMQSI